MCNMNDGLLYTPNVPFLPGYSVKGIYLPFVCEEGRALGVSCTVWPPAVWAFPVSIVDLALVMGVPHATVGADFYFVWALPRGMTMRLAGVAPYVRYPARLD